MKKVLYYKVLQYQKEALQLLREQFDVVELEDPRKDTPEILSVIQIVFAPLGYMVDKKKIDAMPLLEVIASNTTGDPHIDVSYAQSKGIAVLTLKGEYAFLDSITPTAELTWGLIIALIRNMPDAMRGVREGVWNRWNFGGTAMLSRLSLGIIGLGRLGSMVGTYAKAFRMPSIKYFDPFKVSTDPVFEKMESLHDLVAGSDIVTLHVPALPETQNLIDAEAFSHFKEGSYFINTSRAELVDNEALLDALETGRLRGVALDVFPGEFDPEFRQTLASHPLFRYMKEHSNLLITPHIGGSTLDAWRETQIFTIQKILSYYEKKR